jgi:hypothetical protein
VRSSIAGLGLLLFGAASAAAPRTGHRHATVELPPADRVRLAEGRRLAARICDQLWPGWGRAVFQVLLVGDSTEYLLDSHRPPDAFTSLGYDSVLGAEVWARPRRFPPTLLATFPAVGGIPTIVIGSATRTGKSSTAWILTLLHEHFHQWQYSRPGYQDGVSRLGLARGYTTGQWMLNYPFPYDSAPVQRAVRTLAASLLQALDARPDTRARALAAVREDQAALRKLLTAADYRYLEFQLWQEGVARFTEYAAARAAVHAGNPNADFRSLPDYQPYDQASDSALRGLRRELAQLDLAQQRRVTFYPIGAAWALLLDQTRPDWKRVYARQPFTLPDLVSGAR